MKRFLREGVHAFEAPFAIGALVVVVFVVWAASDAGYAPRTWYPSALFVLALVVIAAVAYRGVRLPMPTLLAIAFLFAFAAWTCVSIAWSSDRGIAWDGANRTVLYALVFALFAGVPWRRASVPFLLCSFSVGVLAVGLTDLVRAAVGDTGEFFIYGRFSSPAGYPNAACALYLFSFWPLAYLAARPEPPALLRGLALAAAVVLAELALLSQSRGSLFAAPLVAAIYLLTVPRRLRAGVALLVIGIAVFLARAELLDVYDPVRRGEGAAEAVQDALGAIAISAAAVLLVWTFVAWLEGRVEFGSRAVRVANVAAIVLVTGALAVGATAAAVANPGPAERISDAWREFKAGYPEERANSSHFSSGLGNNRYDFWRVAVGQFRDHPLRGVGADNFAEDYIRQRRSKEEPLYPHSLELRVLAQTGLVGALLFGSFLVAIGIGIARGAMAQGDLIGGVMRAGVVGAVYWAVHGSADWFWEFPGLTGPAFAWVGLAMAPPTVGATNPLRGRGVLAAVGTIAAVVAAVSFTFPWLADAKARNAAQTWGREPEGAFADLGQARELNRLSARPDLLAGAVASKLDDLPRMRLAFRRAVSRTPRAWYAHFELGLAEAALGRQAEALGELRTAARLNPREPVIDSVRRKVARGEVIDRDRIDRLFVGRVRARVGP